MTKRVLFLCTANSARSIMAEALLRFHGGAQFEVASAGTQPGTVDPRTLEALSAFGIATDHLRSKPLHEFADQHFDFVITLCSKASQECKHWPGAGVVINWDFPDPAASDDPLAFKRAVQEINERIKLFVLVNSRHEASDIRAASPLTFFKCLSDETRLLSLLLIRQAGELCVCELVEALALTQPTISRHLAMLRKEGILLDRRQGQWVYYRLHPLLPAWMTTVLAQTAEHHPELVAAASERLAVMANRPSICTTDH